MVFVQTSQNVSIQDDLGLFIRVYWDSSGSDPIDLNDRTGSDVMQRIAAPMIGGMITAPLVSMVLIPVIYYLWQKKRLQKGCELVVEEREEIL